MCWKKKKKDHGFLVAVCEYVKVFVVDITTVIIMFKPLLEFDVAANF